MNRTRSLRIHLVKSVTALVCALTLLACDKIPEQPSFKGADGKAVKMVVVNEGFFTANTAALSVIYEDGETLFDVFRQVNHRPLGDVAQSMNNDQRALFRGYE